MEKWIHKIRRMSLSQLRALKVLVESKNGIIEAYDAEREIGLKGKALGGVFSSLSRQKINNQSLVLVWGRSEAGRGLRWKLNTELINVLELNRVIREIIE